MVYSLIKKDAELRWICQLKTLDRYRQQIQLGRDGQSLFATHQRNQLDEMAEASIK